MSALVANIGDRLKAAESDPVVQAAAGERGGVALAEAPQAPAEEATAEDSEASSESSNAKVLKDKFESLGIAVRAGVDPDDAAARLGLAGIRLTGATPVSLRPKDATD